MHINSLLLTGLMATAAMGAAVYAPPLGRFSCRTPAPTREHKEMSKLLAEQEAKSDFSALATISVGVYFHVVSSKTNNKLTDAVLNKQLQVINEDYAPAGISFTLKGIDRTVNSKWAGDGDELGMKKALRKGTYKDLNIYFMSDLGEDLGFCYFPTNVSPGSTDFYLDGCAILDTTVPGGALEGFNEGKTVTHEVGHWFGLYHTFEGGCLGSGDFIDDTAAEASPASGCPTTRDSCPKQPGLDPVHNYMDYSDDACYEEFTAGQMRRMVSSWNQYRK